MFLLLIQFFLRFFSELTYDYKHEGCPSWGCPVREFDTLNLNSIIKGEGMGKQDCWVLRMILNLPSRMPCRAHFISLVDLAEPGSCLVNLFSKSMLGKILVVPLFLSAGPQGTVCEGIFHVSS